MPICYIIRSVFPVSAVSALLLLSIIAQISTYFNAGFMLGLFFDPEDDGDMFLRNDC
jgi:hypothetical protein